MDPYSDPYMSCPYNPVHRVPRSRLQQHVVKCEKKYPTLAICPYNATHRFPKDKIKAHIGACPAREQFLLENKPSTPSNITTPQPIAPEEYLSVDDPDYESWD